ncbi:hypothetical protein H072_3466 [Dactylellina haptotyla CBS 200.50]|uniref:Azaphilone pigments biosynthesis cluster protein L N-terminal domain-containing protein n=1 Tax=Dactylellina haptotyla (strain CBS 200.50) TaxID=1284197 RepID=S8C4D3_DACHA|nr:hypothetical protein H072_3466 [Dactylellina haptotyla CBS 200.50]
MEAAGAAASIIQIVAVAIQTTKLAYETISNILHAPESVRILQEQIEGLLQVLYNILELGQQCQNIRPSSAPTNNALVRLKLQVKSCQENVADILHRFKKLVETDGDKTIRKLGKRIRVILKDEDLKGWSNILSVHLDQLGIGVGVLESHIALWQARQFERQGHSNLLQHGETHDKLDRLASSISAGQIDVNSNLSNMLNYLNAQSNIMSTVSANINSQQIKLIGRLDRIENSVQTGFDTQQKSGNSILRNIQDLAAKVDLGFSQNCDLMAKQGGQSQQLMGMMEQIISIMQNIQTTSNTNFQALQSVDPPQVPPEAQQMGLTNFESVWHELSLIRSSGRQTLDNLSPEIMNYFNLFNTALQSVKERLPQISDYRSVVSLKKKEMITDVEYQDWEELYASLRNIESAKRALRVASSMRHTTLNKRSAKGYPSRLRLRSTTTMSNEYQGCSVAVETTKATWETFTGHGLPRSQIREFHGGSSGKETEEEIITTFFDIRNSNELASMFGYSELQISMLITESITRYGNLISIPCLVMRNVRGWDETSQKVIHAARRGDTAVLSYLFASGKASPKDYYSELPVSSPKSLIGMAADIPTIKFLLQAGAELCEDLDLSHNLWSEIFAQTVNWDELFIVLEKYDFDLTVITWYNMLLPALGESFAIQAATLLNKVSVGVAYKMSVVYSTTNADGKTTASLSDG